MRKAVLAQREFYSYATDSPSESRAAGVDRIVGAALQTTQSNGPLVRAGMRRRDNGRTRAIVPLV
jgi:hypothetical protein